jgi:nitroreductase
LWAKQSAVIFLTIARTSLTQSGKPNRHALHDLGLAMGNITFQGNEEGIEFHQMGGFDADKAVSLFRIPEGFDPVAVVAGGYPGSTDTLPENLRSRAERPRSRKPSDEIVFSSSFGHPHPIFIHPAQPN